MLTWVFLLIDYMQGDNIGVCLVGIFLAHIFYFYRDVLPLLPLNKDKNYLNTPQFVNRFAQVLNLENRVVAP